MHQTEELTYIASLGKHFYLESSVQGDPCVQMKLGKVIMTELLSNDLEIKVVNVALLLSATSFGLAAQHYLYCNNNPTHPSPGLVVSCNFTLKRKKLNQLQYFKLRLLYYKMIRLENNSVAVFDCWKLNNIERILKLITKCEKE